MSLFLIFDVFLGVKCCKVFEISVRKDLESRKKSGCYKDLQERSMAAN